MQNAVTLKQCKTKIITKNIQTLKDIIKNYTEII